MPACNLPVVIRPHLQIDNYTVPMLSSDDNKHYAILLLLKVGRNPTRNSTTSRCPCWSAIIRGIAPSLVLHWSVFAPDSTRKRTTSRWPFSAAMKSGVDPSSVLPWSFLAPDSTRNWTTSRWPFWAAIKRGVAPIFLWTWSLLAPASISKDTHFILPLPDAANKGVIPVAPWKLGFRGWFKWCSRSSSSFCKHATMMLWCCSVSEGINSRITSCTTCNVLVSLSSARKALLWRSCSRNRGRPICCAKRCFNAFTETSTISSSSNTANGAPVSAESTSSMWLSEGTSNKAPDCHVSCWNILHLKILSLTLRPSEDHLLSYKYHLLSYN